MNLITKLFTTTVPRNAFVKTTTFRHLPRWASRNPLRVIPPEEFEEQERKIIKKSEPEQKQKTKLKVKEVPSKAQEASKTLVEETKMKWRDQVDSAAVTEPEEILERDSTKENKKPKKKIQAPKKHLQPTDMLESVIDGSGNVIYTKMKDNDARISQLLTTVKSKKDMYRKNLVLLEGKRLIRDALLAGCSLKYLLFSRKVDLERLKQDLPRTGAKMYKTPYREMQMWSDLTTSPGIMGLFRTPTTENYLNKDALPITIYCDNVREPGNLGAILRVAAAVSCKKVYLSAGCTHLWDTKVTRSSAGSHFRVQIVTRQSLDNLRHELSSNADAKLLIADNQIVHSQTAIAGNDSDDGYSSEFDVDSSVSEKPKGGLKELINEIPIVPYYSLDYRTMKRAGNELYLVVGGETRGLSADIYNLAKDFKGVRLNIPMGNGVDSLNTGTALGIISFEIYRQFQSPLKSNVAQNAQTNNS